jgi:RNA polymerase sigma factor (sigma-70 family)
VNTSSIVPPHLVARRLRDLNRSIYASMPWGYRVAGLLVHLAADGLEAFGRTMYAEFVKAAVRGMPDAPHGKPAFDLIQDVFRRGADALPPGYGRPFASRVYKIILVKFGDPEVVEEAMSAVMLRAAQGKFHIGSGSDLHSAESYAVTAVLNAGRDILRAQGRRRESPLVREDDDTTVDIADPETFRDLDRSISPKEMQSILDSVESVHPRAREYLEAVLRGDSQAEWARELGVTDAAVSKLVRKIRPTLQRALREHLRSAALMASRSAYDYRR